MDYIFPPEPPTGPPTREARMIQVAGVVAGLVVGVFIFVIRTGWSPTVAFRSWFGLGP